MLQRVSSWNHIIILFVISTASLAACNESTPSPDFSSVKSSVRAIEEGQHVTYTIYFENEDTARTFINVYMELDYDDDLVLIDANPTPSVVNPANTTAIWLLGTLQEAEEGDLEVTFVAANNLDQAKCEVETIARIEAIDEGGGRISKINRFRSPVSGHNNCVTPTRDESVTMTFSEAVEGVGTIVADSQTLQVTVESRTPSPTDRPTPTTILIPPTIESSAYSTPVFSPTSATPYESGLSEDASQPKNNNEETAIIDFMQENDVIGNGIFLVLGACITGLFTILAVLISRRR